MKEEFDFNKVGKQTPYSVPENFFETNAQRIIEEANRQTKSQRNTRRAVIFSLSAAASIALILSIYLFVNKDNKSSIARIEIDTEVKTLPTSILRVETKKEFITTPKKRMDSRLATKKIIANKPVTEVKSVDDLVASISDETLEEMVMQIDSDPFYELHSY